MKELVFRWKNTKNASWAEDVSVDKPNDSKSENDENDGCGRVLGILIFDIFHEGRGIPCPAPQIFRVRFVFFDIKIFRVDEAGELEFMIPEGDAFIPAENAMQIAVTIKNITTFHNEKIRAIRCRGNRFLGNIFVRQEHHVEIVEFGPGWEV